jgi:hypothetical protein
MRPQRQPLSSVPTGDFALGSTPQPVGPTTRIEHSDASSARLDPLDDGQPNEPSPSDQTT